ncbi:MAG: Uncharacterised protein [Prochlorococcus marinus str. MIT 9313]|nr:MAG: Uncharacterised protein [Prochlorococcus marinus str. MIT 9313]
MDEAQGNFEIAHTAASEGLNEVEHLLVNHTEAL